VQDVPGPPAAAEAAQRRFDAAVRDAAPLIPDYRLDPLGQTAVAGQLAEGRLALVAASARVFADPRRARQAKPTLRRWRPGRPPRCRACSTPWPARAAR